MIEAVGDIDPDSGQLSHLATGSNAEPSAPNDEPTSAVNVKALSVTERADLEELLPFGSTESTEIRQGVSLEADLSSVDHHGLPVCLLGLGRPGHEWVDRSDRCSVQPELDLADVAGVEE